MMWFNILCVILCGLLGSCQKKDIKMSVHDDFESLSGKGTEAWQYVQTKQDIEYLDSFKRLYELKKGLLSVTSKDARIPHIVHFIWIGPRPFPRESVENVRTWMAKHPDWTFYFWTDRDRPTPCPGMHRRLVQDFTFLQLKECYLKADNFGEKSDVLRYEILYREGGVYVDHDVKCFRAFDPLNSAYDFYCGIDMPYTSSLPSCVFPTNNLIGVRAEHPILKECMQSLVDNWERIGQEYPGSDRDAMMNRVLHRTFWLFGEAVRQNNNRGQNKDIVFPAHYFDAPRDELALYARHLYAGVWHENKTVFEKSVSHRLMYLSKKSNKILLLVGAMAGLNLAGFIAIFTLLKRKKA